MKFVGAGLVFIALTGLHVVLGDAVDAGAKQGTVEPLAMAKPEQMIITPAPVNPPGCTTFSDAALEATKGVLCTAQYISKNTTKIICNDWKPECHKTVTEWKLLDPLANGGDQQEYAKTAIAACQLLGFSSFGAGTTHTIGPTKKNCWNGKGWQEDNWWTELVCCK